MRRAILISALLLAGCGSGPAWENEQSELANDLNATAPAMANSNASETDYLNETTPAVNDANAMSPVENEATPPPEG